jgi:hypothetical protein
MVLFPVVPFPVLVLIPVISPFMDLVSVLVSVSGAYFLTQHLNKRQDRRIKNKNKNLNSKGQ